jgi:hypothetical protein
MAVGAADLTFGELIEDSWPGEAALDHLIQLQSLRGWLNMIELQNQRVSMAAVDTWVLEQELPETSLPFDPARAEQLAVSFDVREAIAAVVLAPVRGKAFTANVLTAAFLLVPVMKTLDRLRLTTLWACLHGYTPSPKCSFAHPNWAAVRRRWQFAHRT